MTGTYSIQVRQVGDDFVATGSVKVGRDYAIRAKARVSAKAIQQLLARAAKGWRGQFGGGNVMGWGDYDEIGFGFLKKLWRGAKKIAKKVASSKVLRKVANTVRNPAFMAALSVVPGVGPAAAAGLAAAGTAYMGLRGAMASKSGNRRVARRAVQAGAAIARRYGVPPQRARQAFRFGRSLAVNPRMLQFMYRGPQQMPGRPAPLQQMIPQVLPQFARAFGF